MKLKSLNLITAEQLFKAFSEESRIRIIHLVRNNEEMCITDLEQVLDFSQTKTSRHLSYLKNAGLLKSKKKDQWNYYQLKEDFTPIIDVILSWFEKDPVLQKDQESFNVMYANNTLAIRKLHNQERRYNLPEL